MAQHSNTPKYDSTPQRNPEVFTETFRPVGIVPDEIKKLAHLNADWKLSDAELLSSCSPGQKIYQIHFTNSPVQLIPETNNAVAVVVAGHKIGYVSPEANAQITRILKSGTIQKITCGIFGGQYKVINDNYTVSTHKSSILRPWREDDAEALYKYASDPDIGPPAGWPPHTSVENSRDIIRTVFSAPETYAICLKDGSPIGSIGLKLNGSTDMTDRDDECELGYWIGKPFWGQGLIPEASRALLRHAFENLGMRAVWCGYYEGNEKSKRVQEKLGFVYQYTTEGLEVSLVNEIRTGHTNLMTREHWREIYQNK